MNSDGRVRRHLPARRADERVDACRQALSGACSQSRPDLMAFLHDLATGRTGGDPGAARVRIGLANARRHSVLPQDPADQDSLPKDPAVGIENDRELATVQRGEKAAKARFRALVEIALGSDPVAAA